MKVKITKWWKNLAHSGTRTHFLSLTRLALDSTVPSNCSKTNMTYDLLTWISIGIPYSSRTSYQVWSFWGKAIGSIILTSSSKLVFFGLIGKTWWPPRHLITGDIFDFSSETAECNLTKLDRKQILNVLYQVCDSRADLKNKLAARPLIGWDIFLWKHWMELNVTWQEIGSRGPLSNLCFLGRSKKKKQVGRPCWLSTKVTHCIQVHDMWPLGPLLSLRNTFRWGNSNAAVVPWSIRLSVHGPCEHNRDYTVACIFGKHVNHDERMNPIGFWRSKVKVTMDIYGNKLVNTIETEPLCISLSNRNLADILTIVRGWTLLILEVKDQGHNGNTWK